jgi:hypothetical protein
MLITVQMVNLSYLLHARPTKMWRRDVVNEFLILIQCYFILIMAGVETNIDALTLIGNRLMYVFFA